MAEQMDFDQFFQEATDKPHTFKLYDIEYHISATIPFGLVLQLRNMKNMNADDELPDDTVIEMVNKVFGKENVLAWCEHADFDTAKMLQMLNWAMNKYGVSNNSPKEQTKTKRGKKDQTVTAA